MANSEFEFLTGNSNLFLPSTSIAYQEYIKDKCHSAVSELNKYGYRCIAMHPYYANGWSRSSVYRYMGFDEMYFLDNYPREKMIRGYVRDQEMFEQIIDRYEINKNQNNKNLFLFGVTMQNHGGYTYDGEDFEYTIQLKGYGKEYPDAEQYLTLIHETDRAVEYLLNYFEQEEREVIVVFFGDHQPALDEEFIEEISTSDYDTIDERLRRYMVPFFIWANYDIPEKEIGLTGLNLLMNEVYKTAELELPKYNRFLENISVTIPYMNKYAYYSVDKQQFIYPEQAESQEKEILNQYRILQYNNMFDHKNRNKDFFSLP